MDVNGIKLCIHCMHRLDDVGLCGHCHKSVKDYVPSPRFLKPGTELNDRYVIGRVVGEGAFGIIYIGWDKVLEFPIAIKEYYPTDMVSRDTLLSNNNNVYLFTDSKNPNIETDYRYNIDKLHEEAQKIIRFAHFSSIVNVRDFFNANNTAYLVMDYVDGERLKDNIERQGMMKCDEVLALMEPLIKDIAKIHEAGVIHRDISPDNILIDSSGKLFLIDFGSAKLLNFDYRTELTIVFKRGFSPIEQYRRKGEFGTWSDVYSICATMYYLISGRIPEESIERMIDDTLPELNELEGVSIPAKLNDAIMKGLSLNVDDRYKNAGDFYEALYDTRPENTGVYSSNSGGVIQRFPRLRKWLYGAAGFLLALLLVSLGNFLIKSKETEASKYGDDILTASEMEEMLEDIRNTPEPVVTETPEVKATKKPKVKAKSTKKPVGKQEVKPKVEPVVKPAVKPAATKKPVATKKPAKKIKELVTKKPATKFQGSID